MDEAQLILLQDAQALVTDLLQNKLSKNIKFHTLQHTQEVVAACEKIAGQTQLSENDCLALFLAAWFHDTGYISGRAKDHETTSVQQATDFLKARGAGEDLTNKVIGCINATRVPQNPSTTIEKIICDADLFHLSTDDFKEKSRLLREELEEFDKKEVSKKDWRKINIRFLEDHKYFTSYGSEKLQPLKKEHLAELKEKMNGDVKPGKKEKEKQKEIKKSFTTEADIAEAKKAKEKEPERGISTVFRVVAQTQTHLSSMADSKAHILISVNSIILSIVIGTLFGKLGSKTNLQLPVILFVIVCVSATVFAILATRPNVTSGTFTREDIHNKKTNLLFFGNFHNMSLQDYDWAMTELLKDKDFLYASLIKDTYFLGVVLAKKYRYLRIAYTIFMYGLVIAILAFAVAFMLPAVGEVYTAG